MIMKICTFGTLRLDIHMYKDEVDFKNYNEIKVDDMMIAMGGSVFNTASVLNEMEQDVFFYMLNLSDTLSEYFKLEMNKRDLNYIVCKSDKNRMPISLIFVDKNGKKKMISYDGVREDRGILNKLENHIREYDLFYSSFYEINQYNYLQLSHIMELSKKSFLDLSPLIYKHDSSIIDRILKQTDIISGTEDEFGILVSKIGISDIIQLINRFNFEYLFLKKGSNGASLIKNNRKIDYQSSKMQLSHDTTGCGDTFNACVIHSLATGVNNEHLILQNAVEMATMVAYNGFNLDLFKRYHS